MLIGLKKPTCFLMHFSITIQSYFCLFTDRDALLISITDALTSIFSGAVVFSIIGYLSHVQNKDVGDPSIATDGKRLFKKKTHCLRLLLTDAKKIF